MRKNICATATPGLNMLYLAPGEEKKRSKREQIDWPARFQQLATEARSPLLKRYYQAGIPSAETRIAETPMVAVDFETTGMDINQHGIVSIAVIPMTRDRIQSGAAKTWLVKPRRVLTEQSVTIHGITHSAIAQAPDLEDVIEPLLAAVAGKVWVVHYHGIERPFLQDAFRERLGESIEFPLIDTMEIEARFRRQQRGIIDRLIDKIKGRQPPSIRLADSRERYHLPFYAPHDAMTDALACGELLQAQLAYHFADNSLLSDVWLP